MHYYKVYGSKLLSSPKYKILLSSERGFYHDLMALCHNKKDNDRGKLMVCTGNPMTLKDISVNLGVPIISCKKWMDKLINIGLVSFENNYYSIVNFKNLQTTTTYSDDYIKIKKFYEEKLKFLRNISEKKSKYLRNLYNKFNKSLLKIKELEKKTGCKLADISNKLEVINNKQDNIYIPDEEIDNIYILYPTRDKNNKNRSTGKGHKDKEHIKKIIKSGIKTADELKAMITYYVQDCERTKTYLLNFGTYLNKLPETEQAKPQNELRLKSFYTYEEYEELKINNPDILDRYNFRRQDLMRGGNVVAGLYPELKGGSNV